MSSDNQFQPSHTPFDFTKYEESSYDIGRIEILKEVIASVQGTSAIDIGCGPGYFSKILLNAGYKTTAIDTDRENIASAGNYAQETHHGDASSVLVKLTESKYDLVLALEVIEHIPKTHAEKLLIEIARVLKRRGNLIISTPNRLSLEGLGGYYWGERIRGWEKWTAWDSTHVHIYTSWEIIKMLKIAGFFIENVIGYHYEGRLPVINLVKLPFAKSATFPFNRLGFNTIIKCHKR